MNTETFNKLLDELDGNSLETLKQKNAKYASANDCLHNFDSGAEIMGSTPAQCAWGYMTKHLVALRDKVERDDFSDRDDLLEKCQDIINYIRFIWLIGNDRAAENVMGEVVEDLKLSRPEWSCENCANYSEDRILYDGSPCWACVSGVNSEGKTISPPTMFITAAKGAANESEENL